METIPCPLCRSDRAQPVYRLADWQHGLGGPFTMVRCQECDLLYVNPRPDSAEMADYYPPDYRPYQRISPGRSNPLQQWGLEKRCRAVRRFARTGRLLDVGCANGSFLARMRGRGDWELTGVEPDASAAEQARQQGLTVYQAPLAQVILPSESFDVVTLWDVLEHLPSPQDALTRIRGWLRPGGWLVIRTPDADSPYARFFGRTWAGLDAPRHPVVFSRSTLSRLLTECGFHVERMWVLSGSHASTVLSCRFWLQERGWNAEWSRLLDNPLAQVVTAPLFWLIDRWGGAAVTVVSQRKD